MGHGYEIEESIGLVAAANRVRSHPRENREVVVRRLDPSAGADEELGFERAEHVAGVCRWPGSV